MWRPLALSGATTTAILILASTPAWAPGSITFEEVLTFARQNPTLMQEIERAIKEQKVRPKKIGCSAARFGNHWEYLGGGRALPFSCQIGKRVLEIDGDTEFLDEMGRVIVGGLDNQDVFLKARNIREKNPTWEWSSD